MKIHERESCLKSKLEPKLRQTEVSFEFLIFILFETLNERKWFVCSVCWATSRNSTMGLVLKLMPYTFIVLKNIEQLLAKWYHLWSASYNGRSCTLLIALHIAKWQQFRANLMSSTSQIWLSFLYFLDVFKYCWHNTTLTALLKSWFIGCGSLVNL
jgi:hypothetical protein